MMRNYDITASIVLYKYNQDELDLIIDNIKMCSLNILLILIDNGPIKSKKYDNYNFIKYIFNNKNLGYGKGQNIGLLLSEGRSKYHFILSSDMKIASDFFIKTYNFLETHQKVNVMVPKILNYDNSIQYSIKNLPNPMNLLLRIIPKNLLFKININKNYEIQRSHFVDNYMFVPYGSGAMVIYRNKYKYEQIKFDERFFLYMEDVDWFRSINKITNVLYNPFISIRHYHNAASKKSLYLFLVHIVSAIKYFNKNGWIIDKQRIKINSNFSILYTIDNLK